jgi:putative spermidine/putrescine transport system permease protein/spermidine/putrescine transport system permease protein
MMAPENAAVLLSSSRRERQMLLGLSLPALMLIAVVCAIPVLCLFWLSFVGPDGLTLRNYARIIENPSYLIIFKNTFLASTVITLLAIAFGYPLAYYIATLPDRAATICLALVLVPFWTSLLVRTYAWLVILQRQGLVNQALIGLGVIDRPLQLVYNWQGTVVGMLHIMLPFFILPMYAAIRSIDRDWLRAAASLGASPTVAFWTVFVPLTMPGLLAGAMLVFVYCLGFYVTPAILGGGRVIMVAMKVEQNAAIYSDWGAASALGLVLLVLTLAIFFGIAGLLKRQSGSLA